MQVEVIYQGGRIYVKKKGSKKALGIHGEKTINKKYIICQKIKLYGNNPDDEIKRILNKTYNNHYYCLVDNQTNMLFAYMHMENMKVGSNLFLDNNPGVDVRAIITTKDVADSLIDINFSDKTYVYNYYIERHI